MGLFGGSSSSSQSLNNAITFNPIFNIGDDNNADSQAEQRSEASATAATKDEFGLSAGAALGANSNAQGGAVSDTDTQPTAQLQSLSSGIDNQMLIYGGVGVAVLLGGFLILKKGK